MHFRGLLRSLANHGKQSNVIIGVVPSSELAIRRRAFHPVTAPEGQFLRAFEVDVPSFRIFVRNQDRRVPIGHDLECPPRKYGLVMSCIAPSDARLDGALKSVGASYPVTLPGAFQAGRSGIWS